MPNLSVVQWVCKGLGAQRRSVDRREQDIWITYTKSALRTLLSLSRILTPGKPGRITGDKNLVYEECQTSGSVCHHRLTSSTAFCERVQPANAPFGALPFDTAVIDGSGLSAPRSATPRTMTISVPQRGICETFHTGQTYNSCRKLTSLQNRTTVRAQYSRSGVLNVIEGPHLHESFTK